MASDLTKKDIMDVLLEFHEKVNEPMMNDVLGRIGKLEKGVDGLKKDVGGLKRELSETKLELSNKIDNLDRKLTRITDHQAEVLDRHERDIERLKLMVN